MNLELIKYQLARQFNQHDSAIKNIMLNSGVKRQQFNDRGNFSIKKLNLGVSIHTINDEEGTFCLYFKDLMDLERELGFPILDDLENYAHENEKYVSKEVVTLEGTYLVFKLEHFLLKMNDFTFSQEEHEVVDNEIVFDLKTKQFRNFEAIKPILKSWDCVRQFSFSSYSDMHPTNQLIDSVLELLSRSEIDEQVGSWIKSVFTETKPRISKSRGACFIERLMELSGQS